MPRICLLTLAALAIAAHPCAAQTGPRVVTMTLHPTGPPIPAMRYELLPEVRDLRPGNAALAYFHAYSPEWYPNLLRNPDFAHFHEWLDLPLSKAPLERAHTGVAVLILQDLDRGARMESCDWQMLARFREESYAVLVPDMQGFRTLSMLLALRCRLELRDGQFDKVLYSLQTGLAMSKHVAESPTLITYLIGVAGAAHMLNAVELFVQQPGAPNLYWALTDLPRPLIDLRRPLQGERVGVDGLFPEVRRAMRDRTAPPVPIPTLQANLRKLAMFTRHNDPPTGPLIDSVLAATTYPRARQYLLDQGRSAEEIAALPVTQVALMYALSQHDLWAEDFYKLNNLPYWEARPRLQELNAKWSAAGPDKLRDMPFVGVLHFNPQSIYYHKARLQRRVDLLRCVEAVRLHAAANVGALPASLNDIHAVPIPIDPVTGKAFDYLRDGDKAVLAAPAPPGEPASENNAIRIEISLAAVQKKTN